MKHRLLFICTHNRCRSILAEAIARDLLESQGASSLIEVASAGSQPAGEVHPLSLKFLAARNIPTAELHSQSWNEFESYAPTTVLSMCDQAAKESCPIWFSDSPRVNWGLADPSKVTSSEREISAAFNQTIDIIEQRINELLNLDLKNIDASALASHLDRIAV